MKKTSTLKARAAKPSPAAMKDLPLRAKGAKAVKGGLTTAIVPCVKTRLIIPCVKPILRQG